MHEDNLFGTWLRDDTESKAEELEDINTGVDGMRQRVATRRLKEAAKGSKLTERVCLPEKSVRGEWWSGCGSAGGGLWEVTVRWLNVLVRVLVRVVSLTAYLDSEIDTFAVSSPNSQV